MWEASEPQPNAALQSLVEGKTLETLIAAPDMPAAERTRLADQIRRFYKDQNYRLVWLDGDRPAGRYQELIKVLNSANEQGLPTDLYYVTLEQPTPESDVRTTATFFRYFFHLTGGRLDPRALQSVWTLRPEKPDLVAALTGALKNNDLVKVMERLQPPQEEYRELQKALVRYRAVAAKGGWPTIPANTKVKPGQPSEWTPEAIDQAMKSGQEKHVKLNVAIPVYILYKTAWVHEGGVRFLKDLYGYDADQTAKLWPDAAPKSDGKLQTRR